MGTTSAERMKLHRDRERLGLRPVQVLVSEQEIDFLLARENPFGISFLAPFAARSSDMSPSCCK